MRKDKEEIIIHCLRYAAPAVHDESALRWKSANASKIDPVTTVVSVFGILWVGAFFMMVGAGKFSSSSYWLAKAVPLLLLPLLGSTRRRITHIRCDVEYLHLETRAESKLLKEVKVPWRDLKRVFVENVEHGELTKKSRIVFEQKATALTRNSAIKLLELGTEENWQKLLTAITRWSGVPLENVPPDLFQRSLSVRDPSFTSLWLDAMACPPQRQKLEPLPPDTVLQAGQYTVSAQIGAGGQGRAYLADSQKHGAVVLKEYILPVYVDPKVRKQALYEFEAEARTLCSITSENIVRLHDQFFEDHRCYLVMEYIPGPSLREVVKQSGPLSNEQVLACAKEMCAILEALHFHAPPVVHRDFTPDNLLRAPDGRLKLIDFTIATTAEGESADAAAGKIHYMPPEQFRGNAIPASDIYALGCTLFYLLMAEDPEPITTSFPILHNDCVDPALSDIVAKCTALDPAQRPTIRELEALVQCRR